jgi:hypothetical protein
MSVAFCRKMHAVFLAYIILRTLITLELTTYVKRIKQATGIAVISIYIVKFCDNTGYRPLLLGSEFLFTLLTYLLMELRPS